MDRRTDIDDIWPSVWWTRGQIAITLFTQADNQRGPYFEWATGDLVVTTQRVGDKYGERPGPEYGHPSDCPGPTDA